MFMVNSTRATGRQTAKGTGDCAQMGLARLSVLKDQ